MNTQMELELARCISNKNNKQIYQFYNIQQCQYTKIKIISSLTQNQIKYYQHLLTPKLQNIFSNIESNFEKKMLTIKTKYINCISLSSTIRQLVLSFRKLQNKAMINLTFDLIDKLISDGNRSFIPTQHNIFISPAQARLNFISLVGIDFIHLGSQVVSKLQFLEISPFLYQRLLQNSQEKNYVMIKQRAIILFILSLINTKQLSFLFLKEISQNVTLQQAKSLLATQKNRITKYLENKKIVESIQQFQSTNKLKVLPLARLLLVTEQEISWPRFLEQLIPPAKHQTILQQNLHALAKTYWTNRSQFQKRKLISNGLVSLKSISQEYKYIDTNLLLTKLTKTPIMVLWQQKSFVNILLQLSQFDLLNYSLWTNFIKVLLQNKPKDHHKVHQYNNGQSPQSDIQELKGNTGGLGNYTLNSDSHENRSLFNAQGEYGLQFLLELSRKKLSTHFQVHNKKITFNHQKLSALTQYHSAFR